MSSLKPRNTKEVKLSKEQMYEIIRSPIITEKATRVSEYNQVAFRVPLTATKKAIVTLVEGHSIDVTTGV